MSTIAAISTSPGVGGIGIVRMSGKNCFDVLNKIFIQKNPQKIEDIKGYTMKYGKIIDNTNNKVIDEVLVSYFKCPKSYTAEDMCEINSHGGIIVVRKILELCLNNGAQLAEPGEFTKRAFINGRIDLTQAEAIIDIINSKTEKEMQVAQRQLKGRLSNKIEDIRKDILNIMADIEASIDYPEYDIEETTNEKIKKFLNELEEKLNSLEKTFENGKILKEGIKTAIIGKPNVGKSSLLNLILGEERAIVSNVEGTTRDTIEEYVNINGIPLKIIDTAGIRNTIDEVEQIGVKRSMDILFDAELIIAVFDDSRVLDKEDEKILDLIKEKKAIILINKTDLKKGYVQSDERITSLHKTTIPFSVLKEEGINELYNAILELFNMNDIDLENTDIVTSSRQKNYILRAHDALNKAKESVENNMTIDITAIVLKEILEELSSITGENVSEDIINEIFKKFCLGK